MTFWLQPLAATTRLLFSSPECQRHLASNLMMWPQKCSGTDFTYGCLHWPLWISPEGAVAPCTGKMKHQVSSGQALTYRARRGKGWGCRNLEGVNRRNGLEWFVMDFGASHGFAITNTMFKHKKWYVLINQCDTCLGLFKWDQIRKEEKLRLDSIPKHKHDYIVNVICFCCFTMGNCECFLSIFWSIKFEQH